MSLIGYALRQAKEYYDNDTYDHAIRVAINVADNPLIPDKLMDLSIPLAIMHDLLEDTSYEEYNTIPREIERSLKLITKTKNEKYKEYIKEIAFYKEENPEVYWVKIADIKDHLEQTKTLTEELKNKYLEALPYLL